MNKELLYYVLGLKPEEIAKKVILVPFFPLQNFKKEFEQVGKSFAGRMQYKGFTGIKNKQQITVISTGIGASVVGDIVFWLKGLCEIILLAGSAGALNQNLKIGDYFLVREAIDGEGFSQYFLGNPKENFLKALRIPVHQQMLEKCQNIPVHQGKIYTIGSISAEDDMFLELLKNQGIDAIDMETSAFYTAAQINNMQAVALHYISDWPQTQPFYSKLEKETQLSLSYAQEGLPKTVIDLMLSL